MRRNIGGWISVLITAAMLLSFVTLPVTASTTSDERYKRAYSLLSRLDIVKELENDDGSGAAESERLVSRAEFAICLARTVGSGIPSSGSLYYNDVPATHFAFEEITSMTEAGYINGTDYKKFDPDSPIETRHAEVLMLKALGLASYINNGEADDGFINSMLEDSDITRGLSGGVNVTFKDMVMLIYNALIADYYELTVEKVGQHKYRRIEGESLLYKTRNMRYEERELMTAANGADIYGIESDANAVVIGGVKYDSYGEDFSKLLGRRVDYVWLDDDSDRLVWAAQNGDSNELVITIDEDSEYDPETGRLKYYTEDNKQRRVNISTEAAIIYNGRYTGNGLERYASKRHTRLTLLESSGHGYDIVLAESYRNIMVSDVENKEDIYAYDRNGGERVSLNESDYDIMHLLDADGNAVDVSDIKHNDILSVFESEDKDVVKIIQSNTVIGGAVENINSDGYIIINGDTYETFNDSVLQKIRLDSVISGYLDFNGYIAAVETSGVSTNGFVGFILSGAYSEEEITNSVLLKILSEDGTINSYNAAPKLNIDGKSFKGNQLAYEAISTDGTVYSKPVQQIALITLNDSGEIRRIDRAYPDDGASHPLTVNRTIKQDLASVNQAMYTSGQGRIGVNMLVDGNTKVFFVPQNLGDDYSRCIVGKPRAWDDYRGAVSYRTTQKDNFVEQYIVTRQLTYGTIGTTHPIRMVDKVYEAVNADGDIVWMLSCTDGNSFTEYEASDYLELDKYDLHRGDVLRVATTATNNNKLESVSIVTRAGDDAAVGAASRELPYDKGRVVSGYANDRLDYYLKIGWDSGNDFDEILKLTAATPIAVYDSARDKVYTGTIEDIKTQTANGEASRVLVQTNEGTLQRVFVYR